MLRLVALFKLLRKDLVVILLALRHPDTPRKVKGLFLAGMLYLLSPIDLIPDMIPLAGILDDAVVVPGLLYGLMRSLPYHVQQESQARAKYVIHNLPLVLGAASLFILTWVLLILWGVYSLVRYLMA